MEPPSIQLRPKPPSFIYSSTTVLSPTATARGLVSQFLRLQLQFKQQQLQFIQQQQKQRTQPHSRGESLLHRPLPSSSVMGRTGDAEAELNLPPGFRFHPTDEELVVHYLCRKAAHQRLPVPIIAQVDLYKFEPWELPDKALFGQREWYFFTPRHRKYPNGSRPNRAAGRGYWKATGADKPVSAEGSSRPLGVKKALVFYSGKAPRGAKTDWIMHEYRLADTNRSAGKKSSIRLDEWVLCRLYNKKNAWKKMQQSQKESPSPSSLEESTDSMGAVEDRVPHSFRAQEWDVDDTFPEFDNSGMPGLQMARDGNALSFQLVERRPKEEDDDWFLDLNLDELEALGTTTTGMTTGGFDASLDQDCFFQAFGSPQLRPN